MNKLKNILSVCFAIIIASMFFVLPGCKSGKIEVVIWHQWDVEVGEQCHEFKVIVDEFNASQDKIKVVLQKQESSGFSQKVYNAVANGVGPDMMIHFTTQLPEFIEDGLLADMGKYVDLESYRTRLSETLYNDSMAFADEKLHILPIHESAMVFYYNKEMYTTLGLQAPTTWEEVQANAQRIHEEYDIPGFAVDSYVDIAQTLFMQTGATYINTQTKSFGFNTPDCVSRLQWYVDNVNAGNFGTLNFTTGSLEGDFNAGRVGSFLGSCSYYSVLNEDACEYGVVKVPVSGTPWAPIFNTGIIVLASNEERESAACEFVEYLTNAENSARWAMSAGLLSPYNDADTYNGYTQYVQGNKVLDVAQESIAYSYTTPAAIGAQAVRGELEAAFSQAIGGTKTASQALAEAETNSNALLREE